jgi:hypothetical protein
MDPEGSAATPEEMIPSNNFVISTEGKPQALPFDV